MSADNAVRDHVELLHDLAAGIDGVLVVSTFYANPTGTKDAPGAVTHHDIGDVDGMTAAILAHSNTRNANVFVGLQVMRAGLPRGTRGSEADIVAVLGFVADMDADTGKVGTLPLDASFIIETSPGNRQPAWLFDRPLTVAEAKPLAKALQRATCSDSGTGDVTHVWRIPGTLNWPNRKKLDRGRPPEPASVTLVQEFAGELVPVDHLRTVLDPWMSSATEANAVELGELPDVAGIFVSTESTLLLSADDVPNRSDHAASVVEQLSYDGHSAETAAALFMAASGDWTLRYTSDAQQKTDFARMWGKWGAPRETDRAAAAKAAGALLAGRRKPVAANDNETPIDLWARAKHPPLPEDILPPVLENFARVQAEIMGVDPGGLAAATLAVCAAAIPDKIQLQVKAHDKTWTESARIWIALIGQPSAKKSPVMAAASAPLKAIDRDLYQDFAAANAEYEDLSKDDKKTAQRPVNVRLRLEDTTIEAAQEVLKDSPNGVLCLQDELSGWFGSMEKYAPGRGSAKDRGFWLQSFNGGSYTVNRVGRGSMWIDNLSVTLLGGIQPGPIRKIAAEMQDDGLLQRLFPVCMGESSVGEDRPSPPVVAEYASLVRRLHRLEQPKSGLATGPLRFDVGGQAVRAELAEKHHAMGKAWESVNVKLSAHIGKYDGLFARLCVLWHCVETVGLRPEPRVSEDTARRVATFLHAFLLPHAVAFYSGVLGLSDDHDALLATAGFILSGKLETITARDVRRGDRLMRTLDTPAAEAVLQRLDAFGWLVPQPSTRRDSVAYTVLPSVHTVFAERAVEEARRRSEARELIKSAVAA